jgi:hypothetical protein
MNQDHRAYGDLSVRICAVMSSLAVTNESDWAQADDPEYRQLIARERDLIESLFEQGISLKVLVTWNVWEIAEWQIRSREDVVARLRRLRDFCARTLQDESKIKRLQIVHAGVRERNVMILGKRYVFEGRKLDSRAGFEATQVVTDKKRVAQEIEMFDLLFKNSLQRIAQSESTTPTNRFLLEELIARIDRDVVALSSALRGDPK